MPNSLALPYVAGLFDGEGCVNFTRCRTTISIRVLVVNTCRTVLEDLQKKWGGDIHNLSRKAHWKQAFQWRLSGARAVDFLDAIYPWLRIKFSQALVAFAWDAIRPGTGKRTLAVKTETDATIALLKRQLKWLNHRGSLERGPEPVLAELEACNAQ